LKLKQVDTGSEGILVLRNVSPPCFMLVLCVVPL